MRRFGIVLAVSLAAGSAWAQGKEPIALRDMGSFHVGGRVVEITGQPIKEIVFTPGGVPAKMDPNGKYQVGQMYVQYFLPQNRKGKLPLLLWHGGGLTGVTYETTPDGREGWLSYFIRKGWDTYISDAVAAGAPAGPTPSRAPPAYIELVDKVCPCVVMVHSQSGTFGYRVLEARPDKVKALVAVEPTLGGDRNKVESIKATPILVVYGDNAKDHPRWSKIRQGGVDYAAVLKSAGGSIDVVDLPDVGIKGNSHMMMMDKNNAEIADLIQKWLLDKGLAQ